MRACKWRRGLRTTLGSIINQMIDGRQAVAVEEEESQVSTAQTKSRKKRVLRKKECPSFIERIQVT